MDLDVVTVGAELLLGLTVDTNAADIARALAPVGARVVRRVSVPDDEAAVRDAVADALRRSGFVIVSGGLGPTRDDVTRQAVAGLFEAPLVTDDACLRQLETRWAGLGRGGPMPVANRTQALVPEGATVLPNPRGTAPGLWLEDDRGAAVLLPGVPRELQGLLRDEVVPRLRRRLEADGTDGRTIRSRTLRTTGIAESALADLLEAVSVEPVELAFLPSLHGVDLRFVLPDEGRRGGGDRLAAAVEEVRGIVGDYCYGEEDADLAAVVLDGLRAEGARLAVAESCTGGLVGVRLTDVPGSSAGFVGGVIAYDDAVKTEALGVPADLIAAQGAVSKPVVEAMARGARDRFAAEAAIAVSGIAGPGGGSPDKPVGTVWLAASLGGAARTRRVVFPGDRHDIRHRAAQAALDQLRRLLPDRS